MISRQVHHQTKKPDRSRAKKFFQLAASCLATGIQKNPSASRRGNLFAKKKTALAGEESIFALTILRPCFKMILEQKISPYDARRRQAVSCCFNCSKELLRCQASTKGDPFLWNTIFKSLPTRNSVKFASSWLTANRGLSRRMSAEFWRNRQSVASFNSSRWRWKKYPHFKWG